jgi:hypothetical protein
LEDQLKTVLSSVNDWLKFAETKNGALFATNIAIIFGIVRLLIENQSFLLTVRIYLSVAIICLLCSAVLCLVSFIPKLQSPKQIKTRKIGNNDNVLFYMHIADFTSSDYLQALYTQAGREQSPANHSTLEDAYAKQIINNARIARLKYEIFGLAVWFTLSALITPIGSSILYNMRKR